jgi:ribosomal protein S18 acetylase RimI-like enzyme
LWEDVLERTCCPAGVGSMLLKAWLELASKRGATAVHVGVNRANLRALRFRCHDLPG